LRQNVWAGNCGGRTVVLFGGELARQQIGVFLEVGRRRDGANRKDTFVDSCAAGLKARADVLTNLLDLRPHIALSDDIGGLVARDLPADYQ
jgi:hypothetical protein